MDSNFPIIAIEVVMVFGGALLFGWWQLRDIRRDQQKAAEQKLLEAQHNTPTVPVTPNAQDAANSPPSE